MTDHGLLKNTLHQFFSSRLNYLLCISYYARVFGYNRIHKTCANIGLLFFVTYSFLGSYHGAVSGKKKLYIFLCLHDCCLCDCKITFYSTALTWGRVHRKIDAATNAWDISRGTSLSDTRMNAPPQVKWATNAATKLFLACVVQGIREDWKREGEQIMCNVRYTYCNMYA